jgi:hypothetical protein
MQKRRNSDTQIEHEPGERVAGVSFGTYEFKKKGASRFDLRDPYHLAIALTWPQFLAALFALYLSANVVFATVFWLVPGSVAHARPGSFADAFFFSIETLATVGYGEMYPASLYGQCGRGDRDRMRARVHRHSDRPHLRPLLAATRQAGVCRQPGGGDP